MSSPKSLIPTMLVDEAGNSHNCQHSAAHRIVKGQKRLKIKAGRSHEHYCVDCARTSIRRAIERLQALDAELATQQE